MLTDVHHAEIRMESREWIVGHLGPRRRDRTNQCRLTRVRQPEQAHIGNDLQFQFERALLAWQSRAELTG